MVLGLQGVYTLSTFGAESSLGIMVAASLVRELGPVVSALLFAGRLKVYPKPVKIALKNRLLRPNLARNFKLE
jgi:hypothetical protein